MKTYPEISLPGCHIPSLVSVRLALFGFALMLASATSWATVFYWDGNNGTDATAGSDPNIVSAAFNPTQGNNNGATTLLTTSSASSGYAGSSGTTNFGAACKVGALSTATSTYFEITLTPTVIGTVTLNSMTLGSRGTSTGPQLISVFSSIDGYATAIGSVGVLNNSTWASNSIPFSGAFLTGTAGTPVTLRIYGSNGTGSPSVNTANWRIDDINLNVSTTGGYVPPSFAVQPQDLTTPTGTTATFLVSATGTDTISYQWQSNGVNLVDGGRIAGVTTPSLGISNVVFSDATTYRAQVFTNGIFWANSDSATLTVVATNYAPTLTQLPHTNTLVNTPISVFFTIGDDNTPVGSLVLSTNSGNQSLVPDANISITGTAPNLTVTVTPVAGSNGVAPISITVTDEEMVSTTMKFTLMVRPNTSIVAVDDFSYDASGPLIDVSSALWQQHGGNTPGQVDVNGGVVNLQDSESEDVNILLIGRPYPTNFPALYSSFVVNFSSLPSTVGAYIAHFKDDGTANFRDRIYASIFDAAPGFYRLGTGNTTGTTNNTAQVPLDLETGSNYVVVTRLVLSNGVSTIWINPTDESTGGVTDNTVVANPVDIHAFAFRQGGAFGALTLDNLRIGTSFAAVTGGTVAPTPVSLNINLSGNDAVLTWTDTSGLFKLATGTNVTGITNVVATASPYTNTISGQRYFRLVYP